MNTEKDSRREINPSVRASRSGDMPAIAAIYAHHVLHGLASFELLPPDVNEIVRRRADVLARGLPQYGNPHIVLCVHGRASQTTRFTPNPRSLAR